MRHSGKILIVLFFVVAAAVSVRMWPADKSAQTGTQFESASSPFEMVANAQDAAALRETECDALLEFTEEVVNEDVWHENAVDPALVAETLMASPDPEHKFAAAMLTAGEDNVATKIERFRVTLSGSPANAPLLSFLMSECTSEPFATLCEREDIERRLILADQNNADSWAKIAGVRAYDGDLDGSLAALQRAATAPGFDSYSNAYLGIAFRGLTAAGAGDPRSRLVYAIGMSISRPYHGKIIEACGAMSEHDPRWYTSCLSFGKRLESQAMNELERALGQSLQNAVLKESHDPERKKELEALIGQRRARGTDSLKFVYANAAFDNEFFSDDVHVAAFLDAWVNGNEFRAQEYLNRHRQAWRAELCPQESEALTGHGEMETDQ